MAVPRLCVRAERYELPWREVIFRIDQKMRVRFICGTKLGSRVRVL